MSACPARTASQTTHFEGNETQGIQETVHLDFDLDILLIFQSPDPA
jgi:hypothetical protein